MHFKAFLWLYVGSKEPAAHNLEQVSPLDADHDKLFYNEL